MENSGSATRAHQQSRTPEAGISEMRIRAVSWSTNPNLRTWLFKKNESTNLVCQNIRIRDPGISNIRIQEPDVTDNHDPRTWLIEQRIPRTWLIKNSGSANMDSPNESGLLRIADPPKWLVQHLRIRGLGLSKHPDPRTWLI